MMDDADVIEQLLIDDLQTNGDPGDLVMIHGKYIGGRDVHCELTDSLGGKWQLLRVFETLVNYSLYITRLPEGASSGQCTITMKSQTYVDSEPHGVNLGTSKFNLDV